MITLMWLTFSPDASISAKSERKHLFDLYKGWTGGIDEVPIHRRQGIVLAHNKRYWSSYPHRISNTLVYEPEELKLIESYISPTPSNS